MKYYELDKEEQKILEEIEKGEWREVKDFARRKKLLMQIARNILNKGRNINIRLSEKDLQKIKRKAMEEGIPYQTLASSILHKFANR